MQDTLWTYPSATDPQLTRSPPGQLAIVSNTTKTFQKPAFIKEITLCSNTRKCTLLLKLIHPWIFKRPPRPYASESEHPANMGDATVMLVAVLVPCLLTSLAIFMILYHGFYKHWMDRCLHSGSTSRKVPSEQQRHQEPDDDISNSNTSDDAEALGSQGHPGMMFSHTTPSYPWGLR